MTMMSRPEIGGDLLKALQDAHQGDQAAWETLFRECYPKVIRVVRRRLNRSMRSLYDSTDFASDVMKSLAAQFDRLRFPSVDSLMAFLAHVAEQKVIDEYRRQHALKRDISLVVPIVGDEHDDGPRPSQVAEAIELEEWLRDRSDEIVRTIIELKKLGYSTADIAKQTGWNMRKVQRCLKDLQDSMHESGG